MLTLLKNWKGKVEIDGRWYDSIENAISDFKSVSDDIHIKLHSTAQKQSETQSDASESDTQEYRITVKKYMTEKASPGFTFMKQWNDDNPMPLRTMIGTIDKETRGMVHMTLHGDIYADKVFTCMKCGRQLRNPVSQFFGIGPECGGHNYIHPFNTDEELHEAVAQYKKQLQAITWSGWIIKSAIIEKEAMCHP